MGQDPHLYWFVPSLMFLVAVALAVGMVRLDAHLDQNAVKARLWLAALEGDAARSILATLASGMLTVTGIVFSITIVALQLASSQFGPRLLRTFMTDIGNQIVLGTFIPTFVYCLLVLGTVRDDAQFVPHLSIAFGGLLGIADIGVLIYFIHHIAQSIRVESVVASLTADLREVIDALFPSDIGEDPTDEHDAARQAAALGDSHRRVCSTASGYIRHIDETMLMGAAVDHGLVIRIDRRPGDFAVEATDLVSVWSAERVPDEAAERIRTSVVIGPDRTPLQDIRFVFRQLVEVALRALSPGISDPFTAIECVNRLGEALCHVARRCWPSPYRCDEQGRLRVIAEPIDLAAMMRAAFDPIARAGGGNGDVIARLIETVLTVARHTRRSADRALLIDYADALRRQSEGQLALERDRAEVADRFARALAEGGAARGAPGVVAARAADPSAQRGPQRPLVRVQVRRTVGVHRLDVFDLPKRVVADSGAAGTASADACPKCIFLLYTSMIDVARITGFDWDDGNQRKSVDKHDVSQAEAEQVFFNAPLTIAKDLRHSQAEPRWHTLGRTDADRRLHITFTLRRDATRIRVISARDVHRKERAHYEHRT